MVIPNSEKQQEREDLAKHVDNKLETLESQIQHMRKSIDEKDVFIKELAERLKGMEDTWEELQNLDSKIKSQKIKLKAVFSNVTKLGEKCEMQTRQL